MDYRIDPPNSGEIVSVLFNSDSVCSPEQGARTTQFIMTPDRSSGYLRSFAVAGGMLLAQLATAQVAQTNYVPEFSCYQGKFTLHLPKSLTALRRIGKLESEAADAPVDTHSGYSTQSQRLSYRGMTLGVIAFSNDPSRYLITYARVTSPDWRVTGPFRVGQPISGARRELGKVGAKDTTLADEYGSEGGSVRFDHLGGHLSSITYSCHAG